MWTELHYVTQVGLIIIILLPREFGDYRYIPPYPEKMHFLFTLGKWKPGMVVHTCNLKTWEVQANLGCSVIFLYQRKKIRKIEAGEMAQ